MKKQLVVLFALFAALCASPCIQNASAQDFKKQIKEKGRISAADLKKWRTAKASLRSNVTIGVPKGFQENIFVWDRKQDKVTLAVFVNAADFMGIVIEGMQPNDIIQFNSASGIASFAEDKGNPLALSIVGLVGGGASLIFPEAAPLIGAAESYAKNQFKATNAKTKKRDAFGVDPASGHKARQEGGVFVSLPANNGPSFSGNEDHESRWIKKPGDRVTKNHPNQITDGFFLRQGDTQAHKISKAGEVYLTAWDYNFDDNAGYYKVYIQLIKAPKVTVPTKKVN